MPDGGQSQSGDGAASSAILIELGKMSTSLALANQKLDQISLAQTDHETRLRSLETARAKLAGAAVASGMLSGGLATLIYWALTARAR